MVYIFYAGAISREFVCPVIKVYMFTFEFCCARARILVCYVDEHMQFSSWMILRSGISVTGAARACHSQICVRLTCSVSACKHLIYFIPARAARAVRRGRDWSINLLNPPFCALQLAGASDRGVTAYMWNVYFPVGHTGCGAHMGGQMRCWAGSMRSGRLTHRCSSEVGLVRWGCG